MLRSIIPLFLIVFLFCEIAAFVLVGEQIGVLWTLMLVALTSIAGMMLLRVQGFGILARIQAKMEAGEVPGKDLVHGLMIMIAGVLLLLPGFLGDAIGLLLFIPPVRERAWAFLRKRIVVITPHGAGPGSRARGWRRRDGSTIDLDEEEFTRKRNDGDDPPYRPTLPPER